MPKSNIPSQIFSEWKKRSSDEIGFWSKWIRTGGMRWTEGFRRKTDPSAPLAPLIERFLPELDIKVGASLKILDIGSGPLSWVGTYHPNHPIDLVAVDPLAHEYNDALDEKGIKNVLRPIEGYVETSMFQLGSGCFDIVWCANALDHSMDPVLGIYNLINLVRPGGGLILLFHPNEAEQESYSGLHQWNLDHDGSKLWLTREGKKFDLTQLLTGQEAISMIDLGKTSNDKRRKVVFLRKASDCNLSNCLLRH